MSLLRRLFGGPADLPASPPPQHAVLVYVPLSDDEFGEAPEREAIFALENLLVTAIEKADVGEFDGNEFGNGECTLYMYGGDADRLFKAVEAPLRSSPLASREHAVLRYGPPGAEQKQVALGPGA